MDSATAADGLLVSQWRGGDRGAGAVLLDRYRSEVTRFFVRRAPQYAEELTQRTFEGLVRGHRGYRGESSFRRYLFGIARKILLKHYVELNRRTCECLEPEVHCSMSVAAAHGRALVRADLRGAVADALAELPDDLRAVLQDHYWDGRTMNELAELHATKPGTIKSRLFRGRRMMRSRLLQVAPRDELMNVAPEHSEAW